LSQPGAQGPDKKVIPGSGRGWLGKPAPDTQVEITHGLNHPSKNLVVRPAFDLRVQSTPAVPEEGTVRVFARDAGGETQLCVRFPNGEVRVLASE
jgi:hypothetical protein